MTRFGACSACTKTEMWSRSVSRGGSANNAATSNISRSCFPHSSIVVTTRGIMWHRGRSTKGCWSTRRNNISMGALRRPTHCIITLIWTRTQTSSSFVLRLWLSSLVTFSFAMTNSSNVWSTMANRTWPMRSTRSSLKNKMRKRMRWSCSTRKMMCPSTRWPSRTSYASTYPWTTSASACHFDKWRQPSRKPRIARRRRNLLAAMIALLVSTRTSWSLSHCNRTLTFLTMNQFGPCCWLVTKVRIAASRFRPAHTCLLSWQAGQLAPCCDAHVRMPFRCQHFQSDHQVHGCVVH